MVIQSIYLGKSPVLRIYHNRKIVWPIGGGELELELLADIVSTGFHMMTCGDIVTLVLDEQLSSASSLASGAISLLDPVSMGAELNSQTRGDHTFDPLSAVIMVCDAASATKEEMDFLVANAVTMSHLTDMGTKNELYALIANAVYGDHGEDMETKGSVPMIVADAVYGDHKEDQETKQSVPMIVADAVYSAHAQDSGTKGEAGALIATPVPMGAAMDSRSECEAHVLPFQVDQIAVLNCESGAKSSFSGQANPAEAISFGSILHMVTKFEGSLTIATVADIVLEEDDCSAFTGYLSLTTPGGGGEEDEYEWFEPVRTGNNLYIRSVYSAQKDGSNINIDSKG